MSTKRLQRGPQPIIAGVASGIGEYFETDPVWIRLAFVILALGGGAGFLLYVVLWILMPRYGTYATASGPPAGAPPGEGPQERGSSLDDGSGARTADHRGPGVVLGAILVLVGLVFLLQNVGWLWWMRWSLAWPVLLVLIGIGLLARQLR